MYSALTFRKGIRMSASNHAMTEDEFAEILDSRGTDLMSWPLADRNRAEDLLECSSKAQFLLSEAERLEMILTLAPRPRAPSGLVDRIMKAAGTC